ncbi:MAG: 4-(cytidine 5'-diphospho)-2-C-methyl-D-erythritol kinase, partial [Propionibacteriaceae bacterium]
MESRDVDAAVRVQVPGKVNLALSVSPRREDGYHELTTLFMAVSLHDVVTATPARRGRLSVEVSGEGADQVPVDMSNLAL